MRGREGVQAVEEKLTQFSVERRYATVKSEPLLNFFLKEYEEYKKKVKRWI